MSLARLLCADGLELAAVSPYEILVGIWRFLIVSMRFSDSKKTLVMPSMGVRM